MTVFESANLAVQQDMLALQQATLAFQQASLSVQRASVWVSAIVGAAQCAAAGHGLFLLHRYYKRSAKQHRKNMAAIEGRIKSLKAQREAHSEQHQENMEALRELIRRTSATPDSRDG